MESKQEQREFLEVITQKISIFEDKHINKKNLKIMLFIYYYVYL